VSAQLGHALPTTTLQFYARWIPARAERFIEAYSRFRTPHSLTVYLTGMSRPSMQHLFERYYTAHQGSEHFPSSFPRTAH
jgi:hypothetical protein